MDALLLAFYNAVDYFCESAVVLANLWFAEDRN